jgi:hypothetical protein
MTALQGMAAILVYFPMTVLLVGSFFSLLGALLRF